MKSEGQIVVLVTSPSLAEAQRIADALVTGRKAACVNIVREVHSSFRWRGELDSADEAMLIIKTRAALLDEVIAVVKSNHSHKVPEVIALPIVGGNMDYLDWLDFETGKR